MFMGKFSVATQQNSLGQSVAGLQIGMTSLAFNDLQTVISLNGSRSLSLDFLTLIFPYSLIFAFHVYAVFIL